MPAGRTVKKATTWWLLIPAVSQHFCGVDGCLVAERKVLLRAPSRRFKALACVTAPRPFRRTSERHSHFYLIIRVWNVWTSPLPGCAEAQVAAGKHKQPPLPCRFRLKPSGPPCLRLGSGTNGFWGFSELSSGPLGVLVYAVKSRRTTGMTESEAS